MPGRGRVELLPLTADRAAWALTPAAARPPLPGLRVADDWPDSHAAPLLALAAEGWVDGQWLVTVPEPGSGVSAVVGLCGVRGADPGGEVEVGYSLAGSARGRGLAGEAVGALVDHLASSPEVRAVVAVTAVGNAPSRRLLQRLGFAVLRDDGELVTYRRPAR